MSLGGTFDLNLQESKLESLKKKSQDPSFWNDQHNASTILKNISKFKIDNYGLLLGSSRKSWIDKIDKSSINQRLGGSIASVLYCLEKGVDVFRVHDVQETSQAIKIYKKIICSK